MDEENLICENCEEQVEELFEAGDGRQLCAACMEDQGYSKCDGCGCWFEDVLEETPSGDILCDECIQGSGTTYQDFVGDCRFLLETVNHTILHMNDDLEKELRVKLAALIKRALVDGDQEAVKTLDPICQIDEYDTDVFTDELLEYMIDDCMSDENIVQTLYVFGYDVEEDSMSEGAHGHDAYGVVYVR